MSTPTITEYRGFTLETSVNGEALQTIANLDGQYKFGTFSHLDKLTSVEKMHAKIDNHFNQIEHEKIN